ncbi:hypothetical protein CHS0354_040097 [Potamilus streckersoni]|uniref:Uncharacterized protein n=1 Tax=Potamilus streckersoni TaxID=2493646 RepID=A0AAE0W186_9BIVA|nr:hypothetical protein CHS0354_040097 [Potamilus streckersoni]
MEEKTKGKEINNHALGGTCDKTVRQMLTLISVATIMAVQLEEGWWSLVVDVTFIVFTILG